MIRFPLPSARVTVQAADGSQAYTRNGELNLTPNGQLVTASGQPVLDDNGNPIAVPPAQGNACIVQIAAESKEPGRPTPKQGPSVSHSTRSAERA